MRLNTAEEWVVENQANDKSHPFHIHINPFQILELFEPNADTKCPIVPTDPTTFDPSVAGFKECAAREKMTPGPWVWWDTFAIPTANQHVNFTCTVSSTSPCPPANLTKYGATCAPPSGNPVSTTVNCTEAINGWFRMRTRFDDFTGMYVLHCHILIHEDQGMMQLIEVTAGPPTSNKSPYSHH
jgi:FtsP/CotA-like multicopper oxidase with cupredoxin domain